MAIGTPELAAFLSVALAKALGGTTASDSGYDPDDKEVARSDIAYRTRAGLFDQGEMQFHDVVVAGELRLIRGPRPAQPTEDHVSNNTLAVAPIVLQPNTTAGELYLAAPCSIPVAESGNVGWARVSSVETSSRWVDLTVGIINSGAELILDSTAVGAGSTLTIASLAIKFEV